MTDVKLLPEVGLGAYDPLFRSTPLSQHNKVGLKCPSARPYGPYVRPSVRPFIHKMFL